MKSLKDLLGEFQREALKASPTQHYTHTFFIVRSLLFMKNAELAIASHVRNPSHDNKKRMAANLHRSLVCLAQAAHLMDLELDSVEMKFHTTDVDSLFLRLWTKDATPLLEQLLYCSHTNVHFLPKWDLNKMLVASIRLLKRRIVSEQNRPDGTSRNR